MRIIATIGTLLLLTASFVQPAFAGCAQTLERVPEAEAKSDQVLNLLKAGKGAEAVTTLMTSSPLMAGRTTEQTQITTQVQGALDLYGPVSGFELVESQRLGSFFVKEYYVVQHRNMVTRWEFEMIKTGAGWTYGYFGFEDQVRTWC
ncbi:hypothetical protein KFK14_00610 [Sphingobium phenoxybenzoativorans]|uniref:DUF4864 domain-containing protein n=1 Tax=Sphingobium phenoxybenzoativorans TaxID=1592790 RepID=A0A975Q229_9SPHN|nr:hypothetical protein [Sphingobium phenoxybenzoativorans]QUT06042.1 hypothetical protein KFK14_00610 [Sphingobium phenoxybenzoativorans]